MKTWSRMATAALAVAALVCVGFASASSADISRPDAVAAPAAAPDAFVQQLAAAKAVPFRPTRTENVFVSIAPCRIANTIGHGSQFTPNSTRNFYVRGTFGFAPQGGKSGGCGVPTYATSVVLTVNALNSTGSGYL